MPTPASPPRAGLSPSFFVVAFAVGAALDTMWVSMPLLAIASGVSPATLGLLYGISTLSVAAAAASSTFVIDRVGPRNILVGALCTIGPGTLVLALPIGVPALALGVVLVGAGIGLFWTGSMATMAAAAVGGRSERAFVRHYAVYIGSSAVGGIAAGLVTNAALSTGLSSMTSLRVSFAVGLVAVAVAAALWRPGRDAGGISVRPRFTDLPRLGVLLQAPCLLLMAAMSLVFPLVPLVLGKTHGYSAVAVGIVIALTAIARMLGSLLGGRLVRLVGSTRATAGMLAIAATATAADVAFSDRPPAFVVLLLVVYVCGPGAWPIAVAAALGRMDPPRRSAMSAAWNLREYVTIAIFVALSGTLFGHGGPTVPLVGAAALIGLAAVAAAIVFQRPEIAALVPDAQTVGSHGL